MNRLFTPLLKRLYPLLAVLVLLYLSVQFLPRSSWNKERLYRQLLTGDPQQRLAAAADLVDLGGQAQLVRALRSDSPLTRDLASRGLWDLWFHAAGDEAYQFVQAAVQLSERRDYTDALGLLDHVTKSYPRFAEGWNRRATLYWQMGEYDKSIADCRTVVRLNPDHFAAWQGMGLCQFLTGDLAGACRSLRVAGRIAPHDEHTRKLLRRCEDLLRQQPPQPRQKGFELI